MVATRYQALFATAGKPVTQEQRLLMEMLYYLDDRHLPILVCYHNRLPSWVKHNAVFSNLYYLAKMIFSRPSVVLVDFALGTRVIAAMLCSRWLQKHRFILVVQGTLCQTSAWMLRGWRCFLSRMIFQVADGILAGSWEFLADINQPERISSKIKFLPSRGYQPAMATAGLIPHLSGLGRPHPAASGLDIAGWKMSFHHNYSRGLRKKIFDSIFEFQHSPRTDPE